MSDIPGPLKGMKTITKRELNQRTAKVLAEVDAGESVVVTERGVSRRRIVAIGSSPDPIERLRAEGRIIPASKNPPPWPERDYSNRSPADVDRFYAEMREDRSCAGTSTPRSSFMQSCRGVTSGRRAGSTRWRRAARPLPHRHCSGSE